jgi:hypothetical protein
MHADMQAQKRNFEETGKIRRFNPGSRTHARGEDAEESAISKITCNRYKQDRPINARCPAVVEQGGILKRVNIKQQCIVLSTCYVAKHVLKNMLRGKACPKKKGNPSPIPTPQRWLHCIANHIRQHRFECTLLITALFP